MKRPLKLLKNIEGRIFLSILLKESKFKISLYNANTFKLSILINSCISINVWYAYVFIIKVSTFNINVFQCDHHI